MRMATLPSQRGGQSPRQIPTDSSNLENADACDGPTSLTSPSNPSDSKRSDAAHLAQQLASSSPWSEAFMSPAHEPFSTSRLPFHVSGPSNPNPSIREDSVYNSHVNQHDFDPPPAYSNLPQVHELPATPMNNMPATVPDAALPQGAIQPRLSVTDNAQGEQEEEPDVEQPLLGWPPESCSRGGWIQWWRQRREKAAKRRRFKRFCCLIIFLILVFVAVCIFVNSLDMVSILSLC